MKPYLLVSLVLGLFLQQTLALNLNTLVQSPLQNKSTCCNPSLAILAAIASAGFWVEAAEICPHSANLGKINKTQCVLGSTFGLLLLYISGIAALGLVRVRTRR